MLERIADDLLPAAEAIGLEEQGRLNSMGYERPWTHLYLPMIVTNACIFTATFDGGKVGMDTGQVAAEECQFKQVPCVRFRKNLRTPYIGVPKTPIPKGGDDVLRYQNQYGERTILVVSSISLVETLGKLRAPPPRDSEFERLLVVLESQK